MNSLCVCVSQGCGPPLVRWVHDIYIIAGWATAGVGATMVSKGCCCCCWC